MKGTLRVPGRTARSRKASPGQRRLRGSGASPAEVAGRTSPSLEWSILDSLPESIVVVSMDCRVLFTNRAAAALQGGMLGGAGGELCYERLHGSDTPCQGERHPCPLELVRASGRSVRVVHEHRTASGTRNLVEVLAAPLWGEGGTLEGIVETLRDVTERTVAQESLLEYRHRLEAVKTIGALANATLDLSEVLDRILRGTIEATGATVGMIFLRDPETGCLEWGASVGLSDAFVSAFRERPIQPGEGLTGRIAATGQPIYIRQDSSNDPRIAREVVKAEGLNSFIGVAVRAGEEIVAVMNILTRPPDVLEPEEITLSAAIGTYVGSAIRNARLFAKLQRAEAALTAEKERLDVALHSIADGVVTADTGGRVVLMNDAAEKLTGWRHEEVAGRSLDEVVRIVEGKSGRGDLGGARGGERAPTEVPRGGDGEGVLVTRDGRERLIEWSLAPIRNDQGEILGEVLVFRDVTEKRR